MAKIDTWVKWSILRETFGHTKYGYNIVRSISNHARQGHIKRAYCTKNGKHYYLYSIKSVADYINSRKVKSES